MGLFDAVEKLFDEVVETVSETGEVVGEAAGDVVDAVLGGAEDLGAAARNAVHEGMDFASSGLRLAKKVREHSEELPDDVIQDGRDIVVGLTKTIKGTLNEMGVASDPVEQTKELVRDGLNDGKDFANHEFEVLKEGASDWARPFITGGIETAEVAIETAKSVSETVLGKDEDGGDAAVDREEGADPSVLDIPRDPIGDLVDGFAAILKNPAEAIQEGTEVGYDVLDTVVGNLTEGASDWARPFVTGGIETAEVAIQTAESLSETALGKNEDAEVAPAETGSTSSALSAEPAQNFTIADFASFLKQVESCQSIGQELDAPYEAGLVPRDTGEMLWLRGGEPELPSRDSDHAEKSFGTDTFFNDDPSGRFEDVSTPPPEFFG